MTVFSGRVVPFLGTLWDDVTEGRRTLDGEHRPLQRGGARGAEWVGPGKHQRAGPFPEQVKLVHV